MPGDRVTSVASVTSLSSVVSKRLPTQIRRAYERYVAFHSEYAEAEAGVLTLWTFHTWAYWAAEVTPYLLITAPTSEAGKSRVFDVARMLVRDPYAGISPTPAAVFRTIDMLHPTLLIDEADMLDEVKMLRSVLNAGFQPGTPVLRAKTHYDVFCPKMFAGISGRKPPLSRATLSRCIQIPMRRRLASERITAFYLRRARKELEPLHDALREWAGSDLVVNALEAELELPRIQGLSDRQNDMWEPLRRIALVLGGAWPKNAVEWAHVLTRAVPKEPDPAVQLLVDCKKVLDRWPRSKIWTRVLAELRNELDPREFEETLSARQLGRQLSAMGIHPSPKSWREGEGVNRGFVVRSRGKYTPQWADAFARYGLLRDSERTHVTHGTRKGGK